MDRFPSQHFRDPTIIFEDEYLLVIDKPPLMHSVSISTESPASVADWIRTRYPKMTQASERAGDCGLVNRLDFETSGILVAAKTKPSWEILRAHYKTQETRKCYLVVVSGGLTDAIIVQGFLGGRHRKSIKVSFSKNEHPRFQFTNSVIGATIEYNEEFDCSLIEVETRTGARHQVRVHCAHVGHPLIGDKLYGGKPSTQVSPCDGLPPFKLHAKKIEFSHPDTGQLLTFEAQTPPYFWKSQQLLA